MKNKSQNIFNKVSNKIRVIDNNIYSHPGIRNFILISLLIIVSFYSFKFFQLKYISRSIASTDEGYLQMLWSWIKAHPFLGTVILYFYINEILSIIIMGTGKIGLFIHKFFYIISMPLAFIILVVVANPLVWIFYGGYLVFSGEIFSSQISQVHAMLLIYTICDGVISRATLNKMQSGYSMYDIGGDSSLLIGKVIITLIMIATIRFIPGFSLGLKDILCYPLYFKIAVYFFLAFYFSRNLKYSLANKNT